MYVKINNGVPEEHSIARLRRENPQVSFPKQFNDDLLAAYGLHLVKELPKPEYDARTHYLKQSAFYQVNGKWQVHYSAEPLPSEQIEEVLRSAYQNEADPLFFKWQRGEGTQEQWLAKVAEIKVRFA